MSLAHALHFCEDIPAGQLARYMGFSSVGPCGACGEPLYLSARQGWCCGNPRCEEDSLLLWSDLADEEE